MSSVDTISRGPASGPAGSAARLRVLIVAPSVDILGGQSIQAARLLTRLKDEPGLSVGFLPVNPRLPGRLRFLQRIKYLRTVLTFPYYVLTVAWSARRFDVLHIFSASYLSFLLAPAPALLAARFWRRRTILNYRSGEAEDHLRRWGRTALPLIRLAGSIIVPSGYLVDVFRRFGLTAQSIPNFVDLDTFTFRDRTHLAPVFLSNRNLEPLYNVVCTIDAFAAIQSLMPEARLVIAGDGSDRRALEAKVKAERLSNVTFLGQIEAAGMSDLYQAADIYLNSPNIDNMPTSIIEAFACGLPVVTSDAGGIPYFVEHDRTGLIFPKGDAQAMAAQIRRLFYEPGLARRLVIAARNECEKYRWTSVRRSWLAAYHG